MFSFSRNRFWGSTALFNRASRSYIASVLHLARHPGNSRSYKSRNVGSTFVSRASPTKKFGLVVSKMLENHTRTPSTTWLARKHHGGRPRDLGGGGRPVAP